ncbi:MAG: IPT/TIG domain-containing protein, partial [bacterium]
RISPSTGPRLVETPIWVRITGGNIPNWQMTDPAYFAQFFDAKPANWEVENVTVQAYIGNAELKELTWENTESILARAPTDGPEGPLPVSLRVTYTIAASKDDGSKETLVIVEEAVLPGAFTLVDYWDEPLILAVLNTNPKLRELGRTNEGPLEGTSPDRPDPIYVIGYNFSENMEIYFGENRAELVGTPFIGPPEGIDWDWGGAGELRPEWQRIVLPPAARPGPVTVRVVRRDEDGEKVGYLPLGFIYRDTDMSVAQLFPKSGPSSGGQRVTITGANLDLVTAVIFGSQPGTNLEVAADGTYLTVITDRHELGTVDVRLIDPFGTLVLENAYEYVMDEFQLDLRAVTPNWAKRTGGDVVYIESVYPINGPRVFFGETEARQVELMRKDELPAQERDKIEWQDDEAVFVLRVVVPPGATGWTEVRVTNLKGDVQTFPFYYQSQPEIDAVEPAHASLQGGNIITVKGRDFLGEFKQEDPLTLFPQPDGATGRLTIKLTGPGNTSITCDEWEIKEDGLVFRIPFREAGEYPEGRYTLTVTNADGGRVARENAISFLWAPSRPKIDGFVPDKGTFRGGTSVVVTGQNFDNPRLYFGLEEAAIDEHSLLTIRAKTPPYSGERKPEGVKVKVTVINEDGAVAIADAYFTYTFPEPGLSVRIRSVFPDLVLAYNENPVIIEGQGFQPGDLEDPEGTKLEVFIGYERAEIVAVRDEEGNPVTGDQLGAVIEIRTPRLAPGTYDVTVVNPDTSLARREQALTFRLRETRPVIDQIIPDIGPTGGGTRVIIRGEDFRPGARIFFGTTPATDVNVVDAETIVARTPASSPGKRDVMVVNPDGASYILKDGFEYLEIQDSIPRITAVIPDEGPVTGGTRIRIIGQDFYYGDDGRVRVFIGYNEAYEGLEVRNINEHNYGDEIIVFTPPGEPGTYDIFVYNPDGASFLLERAFTYREIPASPKILGLDPAIGPVSGGIPIVITGENFAPGMEVYFGNQQATEVVVEDATQAIAWLPPVRAPQRVDVLVINPDGGSDLLEKGFEYVQPEDAPEIHALDPDWGRTTGSTPVTITGAKFQQGAVVFFGGRPAQEVRYEGPGKLTVLTPPGGAGPADVVVINPDGGAAILPGGFLYKEVPGPTITSVDPNQGHTAGGEQVTISGANFDAGVRVYFGTEPALVVEEGPERLLVTTPAHDPGPVDIRVVNPDGTEATAPGAFLYVGPPKAPEDVTIFLVEDTVIGLTWQAMPGALGYEVYGRPSGRREMSFMGASAENYIYLTGLEPNTLYYLEIRAVNLYWASDFSSIRVTARTERAKGITSPAYPPADVYQIVGDTARVVLQEDHFRSQSSYTLDLQGPAYAGVKKFQIFIPARELRKEGILLLKAREFQLSLPLTALGASRSSSDYGVISLEMVQGPEKELLTRLAPGRGQGQLYRISAYFQRDRSQVEISRFRRDLQLTFTGLPQNREPAFYRYNPALDRWLEGSLYWHMPLNMAIVQIGQPGLYLLKEK